MILLAKPPLLRTGGATLEALGVVEAPREGTPLLTISFWLKLKNAWLNH
jgi:hypothetical protein